MQQQIYIFRATDGWLKLFWEVQTMKYSEIFIKDGIEYVTDENGHEYKVFTSKNYNGEKYIELDNQLDTEDEGPFIKTFTGRIKDAVETIRNGDGDAISVSQFLGSKIIYVIHFLNREFGEEIKKKSLDGWKDAKFGWIIIFGGRSSMTRAYPLTEKNEVHMFFDNDAPKVFDTMGDAKAYMTSLLDTAKTYAEKYSDIAVDKNAGEIEKLKNDLFQELITNFGFSNIIGDITFDMLDKDLKVFNNFKLTNYYYKFEQYLIP